jgi:hypothetical protein
LFFSTELFFAMLGSLYPRLRGFAQRLTAGTGN